MSQTNLKQDTQLANFSGIVLMLTFIVIFAFIRSNSDDPQVVSPAPTSVGEPAVAQVVPTATAQPTASLSPTNTPTLQPSPTPVPTSTASPSPASSNTEQAGTAYDPALVDHGEALFSQCAACHGPDARGIPNLGKDLVDSEFVAAQTDDALVQFIITGRPIWDPDNTTGIDMPGKGGNPALTSDDIQAIVAYLRTLSAQDSGQPDAAPVSNESTAYDPALVEHGDTLFVQCAACHGPDARGIPNLGKDLVDSEFVAGLTDEALLEFIKTGRPIWDPDNTTGIDMPGKGGNPALTDEDIMAIIAYLRSLSTQ